MDKLASDLANRLLLVGAKLAQGMRLHEEAIRLTASQQQLLAVLVRDGPIKPTRIGVELHKHGTAIARTISELTERGFVERVADAADRRCVHVRLTDAGRRAHDAELAARIVPLAGQLAALEPGAVHTLQRALDLMETLVRD